MRPTLDIFLLLAISSTAVADQKLTNKVTVEGQTFTSTVLMKDGKVRNEVTVGSASLIGIQDCGHHQVVSINGRTKTFVVTDVDERPLTEREARSTVTPPVVIKVNEQDTGERQKFFGYTARHIKGTMNARGGEGACSVDSHAAVDGWYIDLPEYQSCSPAEHSIFRERMLSTSEDCKQRFTVNASGVDQPGYPVLIDMNLSTDKGEVSIHQETVDLAPATLDAGLFEVPAGYKQIESYRELMGNTVASSPIGGQSTAPNFPPVTNGGVNENKPGVVAGDTQRLSPKTGPVKIGITQITTSAEQPFAVDGLQQELANDINFLGGKAIIIPADPFDRDAAKEQAKQQGCDYVVFTEITNVRTASVGEKLGRVFNRGGLGGVGGSGQGRVEIDAQVKVFQPDGETPVLDGSANFRQNDPEHTAKGLMQTEARTVMLELKKLQSAK